MSGPDNVAPKRFPDRVEIASVLAECEPLEAGQSGDVSRRIAGRAMARRDMGKLVFLDVVDRSGESRSSARRRRPASSTCCSATSSASPGSRALTPRRAVAACGHGRGPGPQHPVAARYVPRPHRRRAALPQALPRPARQRGARKDFMLRARLITAVRAYLDARGLRRGRDAGIATPLRRSVRAAVRHAPQRARPRPLSPHRHRALPQAPDRRRSRARVRARQGLPQRGRLVQAQPGVHDARAGRGLRRLPRHDGTNREARRDRRSWAWSGAPSCTFVGTRSS